MKSFIQAWLREPQVDGAPERVWRDWVIVAAVFVGLVVEVVLRDDLRTPWVSVPFVALLAISLQWRRTRPFEVVVLCFGGILLYDVVAVIAGYGVLNTYSSAVVLVAMYALHRWGSGRHMLIGTAIAITLAIFTEARENTEVAAAIGSMIGGVIVLEFPAAAGLAVRYLTRSREQTRDQIRVTEREHLARELHDTVAHHVSAIAIQAQAGRFVAESGSLEGAADALEVIEEEASRTLSEMRAIVGSLRDLEAPVEMAPLHSVGDIAELGSSTGTPQVSVSIDPGAAHLGPAVGAALYRIAQESVTNARRHARNASAVEVTVEPAGSDVVLTVTDDGTAPSATVASGFGLIGMAERASLLGGTFEAGPLPTRGWQVRTQLPTETPS